MSRMQQNFRDQAIGISCKGIARNGLWWKRCRHLTNHHFVEILVKIKRKFRSISVLTSISQPCLCPWNNDIFMKIAYKHPQFIVISHLNRHTVLGRNFSTQPIGNHNAYSVNCIELLHFLIFRWKVSIISPSSLDQMQDKMMKRSLFYQHLTIPVLLPQVLVYY